MHIFLFDKQVEHVNAKERYNLVSGGMASGKSMSWIVKFILLSMWFPGTRILIGRRTKSNAQNTFMKDFVDLCPPGMYEHKVGDGKIVFSNGSEGVFFGLDALAGNSGEDLKKAIQELKSHNFGFVFIDQLEEIEERVFEALNSRMRRRQCRHGTRDGKDVVIHRDKDENAIYEECLHCGRYTFNQMNFTTNPANFWGYDFFKANPRPMTRLVETSMLDNRQNLSEQFIQSELQKPRRYVQKFVYGEWSPDSLVEAAVFEEDYRKDQAFNVREPLRQFDGINIFEEPKSEEYQIGIDPSEGAVDPCYVTCMSKTTGKQVASFSGFVPLRVVAEKALHIAHMYSMIDKPMIVCEVQGGGQTVIEEIRRVYDKIYEREVFNHRENKSTNKLGFHTNYATKLQLIEHFKDLLQKRFVKLSDKRVLDEMATFVWTDEAKKRGAGAQNNYHDDSIMGIMMAYWRVEPQSYREKKMQKELQQRKSVVQYQYE